MLGDLLAALCLALILEGMLPFLSPPRWREAVTQLGRLPDRQLRVLGLVLMMVGLLGLHFVRSN